MMITSFEKAYHEVQILVKTFSNNHSHFMSAGYSEAEARQDFKIGRASCRERVLMPV